MDSGNEGVGEASGSGNSGVGRKKRFYGNNVGFLTPDSAGAMELGPDTGTGPPCFLPK